MSDRSDRGFEYVPRWPDGFHVTLMKHQRRLSRERRILREAPPPIPTWSREAFFGHSLNAGSSVAYEEPLTFRTPDGQVSVKPIGELVDSLYRDGDTSGPVAATNVEVPSLSMRRLKMRWRTVSHVERHRHHGSLLRFSLQTGRTITVTSDHSIFSVRNETITCPRASLLKEGDYVLASSTPPTQTKHSDDLLANCEPVTLRIREKEVVHYDRPFVYDLSVPEDENFVCGHGGVVCHNTGTGKTLLLAHEALARMQARVPKENIRGAKIVWFDLLGRGEMCASAVPMTKDHPLYGELVSRGLKPRAYQVEVYRPLLYIRGRPFLEYRQPDIVKPFTVCLQDLTIDAWSALTAGSLTQSAYRMHHRVLTLARRRPDWEEVTLDVLWNIANKLATEKQLVFSRSLEGAEDAAGLPLDMRAYSGKAGAPLLERYAILMDMMFIAPREWKDQTVGTNLDVRKFLEDAKTITVFLLPEIAEAPFVSYGITNYVLSQILWERSLANRNRLRSPPTCIFIPEATMVVPKRVMQEERRYFVEPLRRTVVGISQVAAGSGLHLSVDTQFPRDLDDSFLANIRRLNIFDLGVDAAETTKELMKGRMVSNIDELMDENGRYLRTLRQPGVFVHIGPGYSRAELCSGGLVPFWYPRSGSERGSTESSFYDLFERFFPKRFKDIGDLYAQLQSMTLEGQERASLEAAKEAENTAQRPASEKLAKSELRSPKKLRIGKVSIAIASALTAINKETGLDYFDDYKALVSLISDRAKLKPIDVYRKLPRLEGKGVLLDRGEGKAHIRVKLLPEKLEEIATRSSYPRH